MNAPARTNTMNYLVPASGTTSGAVVKGIFSSTPTIQDWREQALDGEQYVPSGVFIDNTRGAGPLRVRETTTGYTITCPPGQTMGMQYPAPLDQVTEITGDGEAVVIFVNFPVLPFVLPAPTLTDSQGSELPANFESLERSFDYSVTDQITETVSQASPGTGVWQRVTTLEPGTDKPANIGPWVRV